MPRLKQPPFAMQDDAFEVVGVVKDTFNQGLSNPVMAEVYLPFTVAGTGGIFVVRAHADPAGITRTVVNQIYEIDRKRRSPPFKRSPPCSRRTSMRRRVST